MLSLRSFPKINNNKEQVSQLKLKTHKCNSTFGKFSLSVINEAVKRDLEFGTMIKRVSQKLLLGSLLRFSSYDKRGLIISATSLVGGIKTWKKCAYVSKIIAIKKSTSGKKWESLHSFKSNIKYAFKAPQAHVGFTVFCPTVKPVGIYERLLRLLKAAVHDEKDFSLIIST